MKDFVYFIPYTKKMSFKSHRYINMNELVTFLKPFHATQSPYTHVTYIGQKYNIPEKHKSQFHKLYYQALKQDSQKLYFIERSLDQFNYFQDIDSKNSLETIKTSDIQEIIFATLELLQAYTQKSVNYIVSKRNNNYHVTYNIQLTQQQSIELLNQLKNNLTSNLSNILDSSVYKNNGLRMLGSFDKKEMSTAYQLFDIKQNQPLELTFERFQQTLLNGKLNETKKETISSKMNQLISEDITKLLYDLIHNESLKERIKNIDKITKFNLTPDKIKCSKNKLTGLLNFYIIIEDRFCPFIHREHQRISNPIYLQLTHTGIVLKCHDQDCFNKTYPNDPVQLPLDWTELVKMYPTLIKYLTVKYYSAEVNLTEETKELVTKSLSCTHYSIAKVIFHLYKDTFRLDEMKNTEWYQFNGTRWEKTFKLHIYISEELPKYYRSLRVSPQTVFQDPDTPDNQIKYNELIDKCIKKFETAPFKKYIFDELKYLYHDLEPKFLSKLDSNPYLIGFNNGIYDLQQMQFRNGKLTDYITLNTHYDYIQYNKECSVTQDIEKFLKQIITNNAVREYTLKVLGRSLLGIPDEKFYLWTGIQGSNGKSTLFNLLERTFGDYAISCDTSLLTNKRAGSSSATPDLFEMKGRRLVLFQEPENSDQLRTGVMKQLTGGDTIKSRELYKSLVSFKSQGTFLMCCNELPSIKASDGGTWRRIRVTEFTSKFCETPQIHNTNEFKIDPELKEKMQHWPPYFMSILIHYYTLLQKHGNPEPKEVLQATHNYKGDNDKFQDYLNTGILNDQKTQFTPIKDIYENFSEWWLDEFPTEKTPSPSEFKKALKIKYGDPIQGKTSKGYNVSLEQTHTILPE